MNDTNIMIRSDINHALTGYDYTTLKGRNIALTGGTGFLGSWLAEAVAALNDEKQLGISLHLYARHTDKWQKICSHLASRDDITLHRQDVRSSFEFESAADYVIHAAGIPDNRMHASDPLRVFETTVHGAHNSLEAASKLANLSRFMLVSSGLVTRPSTDAGQVHQVYVDAKRAAESLAAIYRSQHRLPIVTVRPYTFIGPYQALDRPWAVNNFMRDSLTGHEIRLHGEGRAKRSYLYGADAAAWVLAMLAGGNDGVAYDLGSSQPIALSKLAEKVASKVSPKPQITLRTLPNADKGQDFIPNGGTVLGLTETCDIDTAIEHTLDWHNLYSL